MDAHELLGLAPGASAHDIKRSFRRLAMLWHPDRNPDPHALEHFKTLRAAYESLLAELASPPPEDGPPDADEGDEQAGGTTPRGADRHHDLTLTIEAAFFGGERTIELDGEDACSACAGSGEEVLRHTRLCASCHGTGRTPGGHGLAPCRHCAGRGYLTKQACPSCHGSGRQRTLWPVIVRLPAGMLDGEELRVAGAGDAAAELAPGDLVLHIRLAPHELYRLDGRNLVLERPVSAPRLLTGGELAIPLPDGIRTLRLEPGTATARTLRVAGAGFPGRDGQAAGDLIVHLQPRLPEAPDEAMRSLLEELDALAAANHSRHLPDVALWETRWLREEPEEP
ncbi:DnaJ C-terminal domain-containing protein [Aromatoleum petrolei]|uniref:DnaJ domain-containing protein n=1 Tax=Aromatoleum petrolei TaxID=76116 RepID=A0ABX1MTT7_9RHOO|nr:DnaJ C-terminal domain-containing protein [Aromatoleum petrolei]NMF88527.1 DnaJ domain-containing protein [Aromatoleum petrolei]QTQ36896.1 Heat shock protein [Aromatoleum petrolei]